MGRLVQTKNPAEGETLLLVGWRRLPDKSGWHLEVFI